jgi:hypothetical protein
MDELTVQRQQLIEEIKALPNETLPELTRFVEYLRYKVTHTNPGVEPTVEQIVEQQTGSSFLQSIAALGTCTEADLSEQDEAILARESDPIHGWSVKP